jgi:hypothetical protein
MKAKTELTLRQKLFGVLLKSQTAFMRYFWKDELSLPPSTRQKVFWNDCSQRVLAATGRKTGKTVYIEARIIRTALAYRGAQRIECALGTPGDNQRRFIWDRLTSKIERNPLFRLLFTQSKNEAKIEAANGVTWYARIDGSDGSDKNWVGLRLGEIIFDEAAFTTHTCHDSRRQSALPNAKWVYCGVPNGIRGTPFYELDRGGGGESWSKHRFSTFVNPLYWSKQAHDRLIADYSKSPQGLVTQVWGGWGEEVFSSFPPESLAIDDRMPYRIVNLPGDVIPGRFDSVHIAQLISRLAIPNIKDMYRYVIGADIGVFQDPTSIGVAYCCKPQGQQDERPALSDWRMLLRINVVKAHTQAQTRVIRAIVFALGEARLAKIAIDKMGPGISIITELLELEGYAPGFWAQRLIKFEAGGTIEVAPKPIDLDKIGDDSQPAHWRVKDKRGQVVRQKEWFTRQLQAALISAKHDLQADFRLWLGPDEELLQELIGTRERRTEAGYTVYIPPTDGHHRLPKDHNTDMLRCVAAAILAFINSPQEADGDDTEWQDAVGWTSKPLFDSGRAWQAPWEKKQRRPGLLHFQP